MSAQDQVQAVGMSAEERASGQYNNESILKALEALHQDGLVVLKSVIDVDHVLKLNEYVCSEVDRRLEQENIIFNHGVRSNILQIAPLAKKELLFDDVYFNSYLIQVANAYLGSTPSWNFLTGNVALKNSNGMRQPVHKDVPYSHPMCPYFFIANIPLCDFSVANGSTEFWLGSHAHTTVKDQVPTALGSEESSSANPTRPVLCDIKADVLEQRRDTRPPIQPFCQKGDIMIRDVRTWHAGMPNSSDEHRVMLALGYQSPHIPGYSHLDVKLPSSQKEFFSGSKPTVRQPVEVRAKFLDTDDEVALHKANLDFDFRPTAVVESDDGFSYNEYVTNKNKMSAAANIPSAKVIAVAT